MPLHLRHRQCMRMLNWSSLTDSATIPFGLNGRQWRLSLQAGPSHARDVKAKAAVAAMRLGCDVGFSTPAG